MYKSILKNHLKIKTKKHHLKIKVEEKVRISREQNCKPLSTEIILTSTWETVLEYLEDWSR